MTPEQLDVLVKQNDALMRALAWRGLPDASTTG